MIRTVPNAGRQFLWKHHADVMRLVIDALDVRARGHAGSPELWFYGSRDARLAYWEQMLKNPDAFAPLRHPSAAPGRFLYIVRRIQECQDPAQRRARIKRMIRDNGPKVFTEPWWSCWE